MLDEYCLRVWGELVPEKNRFREIVSGETIAARPEVQKVLRLIESDRYKAVLIVEPQRLSRGDLEDIGRLSKLLRYTHTIIITLQYSYDLTDERDRDYFERELKRGNEYLEYSKRIMRNGIRLSVERGDYVGSVAPYGYKILKYKDGKRYYHTLEILPDEADVVRLIFELYASGKGATLIANILNDSGITPPRKDVWNQTMIYPILDNPHYIGKIKWNTRKQIVTVSDGEIRKTRPRQQPELYDGKHPPIIDQELWDAVRKNRADRSIPKTRSSFDIQNPLAGLLYCECGSVMVQTAPVRRQKRVYCRNQSKCKNAGCPTSIILEMVADALRQNIADIEAVDNGEPNNMRQISALRSRIKALTEKQDALWESFAEGMPKQTLDRLLERNSEAIRKAEQSLQSAIAVYDAAEQRKALTITLHAALSALNAPDSPAAATNALLKACISRIIYQRNPAEKTLSGGNKGGWKTFDPQVSIEMKL